MNATPEIRLDETRPYSTVHGERNTGDPHYHVHYFQDTLPFSADQRLIPDDGKTEPWTETLGFENGIPNIVRHLPLYNAKMRAIVERRVKKLTATKRVVARAEVDLDIGIDATEQETLMFGPDEVNLISWLKGEINYEPNEIFAACKKRFGQSFTTKRQVVEELVYDRDPPLIPAADVSPSLLAMLDKPVAAAA